MTDAKLLVIGGGGIGGVFAATLLEAGAPLHIAVKRAEIAEALQLRGFTLRDDGGERTIRGAASVFVEPPATGAYDFIVLAVQPNQVVDAAASAAHLLGPTGAFVVLQNGLCEESIAARHGIERVLGGVVSWGASSSAPGCYERTSAGGFTIGRLDGAFDERLSTLAGLLTPIGGVETTTNLPGVRWSKLALNCAVSSLGTIGGDRLGALLVHRFVRRLALEIMTEAVHVALAEGVRLEKVAGTLDLTWIALTDEEVHAELGGPALFAKHSILLAVGAKYRRLRSSMLAAIERGREPPIDWLNGEVVTRGAARGIPTPVNERVVRLVKAIARREARSGLPALRALFDETRRAHRGGRMDAPPSG